MQQPESGMRGYPKWLTRNVFAIGMLSLFSDMGHELTTAVMPIFLATFGQGAQALGIIEGVSDAASSLMKLWMSYYSDKIGKRKPILVVGYFVTAMMGMFGFVTAWWQMVIIRTVAWMGRGARGPVRDALLSESVAREVHGRAFGFEGAMDTAGAIIGPAIALSLIGIIPLKNIFFIAFIPGAITVYITLFALKETPLKAQPELQMLASLKALPATFWRYLTAVGVFGIGNFAHTLLVLQAVSLLTPHYGSVHAGQMAMGLYIFHNVIYAAASYPMGALGDRIDKKRLLAAGYALFSLLCAGFLFAHGNIFFLILLFGLAGLYIAIVDAMERALAANLLPMDRRGTGYGALATVNSFGDLLSSVIVGFLWTHVSIAAGFCFAAIMTFFGAIALFSLRDRHSLQETIK